MPALRRASASASEICVSVMTTSIDVGGTIKARLRLLNLVESHTATTFCAA